MSRRMSWMRGSLPAVSVALALLAPSAARAAVPLPTVTGPLPVSATSYPFGAADQQMIPQDLSKLGYVEEEYLVSGKANVYNWPAAGPAVVRTADAPYTTRILVRRPADPAKSSGNVIVEMLNPSNLFELNIGWGIMQKQLVRDGDTWVGVTAKPVTVAALKKFDPVRYASLSFANPLPLTDPANCTSVASDSSRTTENGLVWDINSQVGAWFKSNDPVNPLRGVVKRDYGFGYSQTGGFLNTYVNAIAKTAVTADGKPVYDAFFIANAGGSFVGLTAINQCASTPPNTDPRRATGNIGVPIIRAMSQSDYISGIAARRADSDDPADPYRHYDVAGEGHASPYELYYSAKPDDILKAGQPVPPMNCNEGPRSRYPTGIVFDAILHNLDQWVQKGIAPPKGQFITVVNNQPVLDAFGNVTGGYRTPYLDVPTSTWFGNSTGASFCSIAGHEVPFSAAQIASLYPTKDDYVAKVAADAQSLVDQRYLTPEDGRYIVQEARYSCTLGPLSDPTLPKCWTDADVGAGGTVPATLSLTLGAPAAFGAFTPGLTKDYAASMTATVISTAGDGTLSVADPSATATGHLVNGTFSLPSALQAKASSTAGAGSGFANVGGSAAPTSLLTYSGPTSNDAVTVAFQQHIGSTDALRTGSYSKTLTFTLSTTTP
jgi:hypothetical protein